MTVTRTAYVPNGTTAVATYEFGTQLEADLATGIRGGNKFRLIARCWVAAAYGAQCGLTTDQYDRFRAQWERKTFGAIHRAFDHVLPRQFRAEGARRPATREAATPRATRTEAQQRAWEKFQKAPARVAKQFRKDAEFYNPDHLPERVQGADHYAQLRNLQNTELRRAELVEALTTEALLEMFNAGRRTGGDLQTWAERQIRG